MEPLKQPKSYSEQIDHLVDYHGLSITDRDEAIQILQRINYYRLSAYGIGLKEPANKERYIAGISLTHLYNLYDFDSQLRNILSPVIESIEVELRSGISYHLSLNYGAEGYRDHSHFITRYNKKQEDIFLNTIKQFDNEVLRQDKLPCVQHHNQKYGGHFPVWVALELFSFGMLSSLFTVMLPQDRRVIASAYNTHPDHLQSWILSILELRNMCAHYNRIYNMQFKKAPYLYKEHRRYASNKLFPALITMKRMIHDPCIWDRFLSSLERLIADFPEVRLSFIGFPIDWKTILTK